MPYLRITCPEISEERRRFIKVVVLATSIRQHFEYRVDTASDCEFILPGQVGYELNISEDGSAVLSSGFDLSYLARKGGPLTSEEADELLDLTRSCLAGSPLITWSYSAGVCQECMRYGDTSFSWNRSTPTIQQQ